jgi:hypothetical protein
MVPSNEKRGSAAVHYQPELVYIHAVAVGDGIEATQTLCGRQPNVEPGSLDFDRVSPTVQCPRCAQLMRGPI